MSGDVQLTRDEYDALMRAIDANAALRARLKSLGALAVRRRTALNAANADNQRLAAANRDLIARVHDLEERLADHLPDPAPDYREG